MRKKTKWSFDFRSKGDWILFAWVISLCVIIGVSITEFGIPWIVALYFFIGLYSSAVLTKWIDRNKRIWKEQRKSKTL